jgi:hypothetical protein
LKDSGRWTVRLPERMDQPVMSVEYQEEGTGRQLSQRRSRVATERPSETSERARLRGQATRQGRTHRSAREPVVAASHVPLIAVITCGSRNRLPNFGPPPGGSGRSRRRGLSQRGGGPPARYRDHVRTKEYGAAPHFPAGSCRVKKKPPARVPVSCTSRAAICWRPRPWGSTKKRTGSACLHVLRRRFFAVDVRQRPLVTR